MSPQEFTPISRELDLLEQVHMALGSAHKLDDFYAIVAGMLVTPELFGFSRAFIFRYDENRHEFTGRTALGARMASEHVRFRDELREEQVALNTQISALEKESSEPAAIQQLYDLRYHALWVQLLQGRGEGTSLNASFQELRIDPDALPPDHLLNFISKTPHSTLLQPGSVSIDMLETYIELPVLAARLKTRRGLHGILVVDRQFEEEPLDQRSLLRFQWMVNHASVSLDNVELVEQLTTTAERTRELDRMKTNFLSIVSHELRTPLTSIIGFVHLLKEGRAGDVSPSQKDLLTRVANHGHHLQNMVNDILEIAEVEAGGFVNVASQVVDPLAVLWRVIPKMESRKSSRQVTVEPVVDNQVADIRTDPAALERIYYHIIDNAIKFIPQTGTVRIKFKRVNRRLEIAIQDSGIGISPDNLKQIFDHFYQVDFRLERAFGGLGIGLTVVKLLLDATGGRMHVESAPDKGSTFTLSYPLA